MQSVVVEDFNGGLVEVQETERAIPKDLKFVYYKSLQHVVLSREFVRYALYSSDTRQLLLYLANVKTSDEMLLATLMQVDNPYYLYFFQVRDEDAQCV